MKKFVIISLLISFILFMLLFIISMIFVVINENSTAPQWFIFSGLSYIFLHIPLGLIAWFKDIKKIINEYVTDMIS